VADNALPVSGNCKSNEHKDKPEIKNARKVRNFDGGKKTKEKGQTFVS
jgi:hypothetical protein